MVQVSEGALSSRRRRRCRVKPDPQRDQRTPSPPTGGQWPVGRCPRARAQPPLLLVMVSVCPRFFIVFSVYPDTVIEMSVDRKSQLINF